jgi:hypothetical protein
MLSTACLMHPPAFLPTFGDAREEGQMPKRAVLAVATTALTLLIASGVAPAV